MENRCQLPVPTDEQRAAADEVAEHVRQLNAALERACDADLRCWVDIIPCNVSGRRYGRPLIRVTVSAPMEAS